MKIKKSQVRKAVMKTLGEYGLARPPLADDLTEAVFDMLKAVEHSVQADGGDARRKWEDTPGEFEPGDEDLFKPAPSG